MYFALFVWLLIAPLAPIALSAENAIPAPLGAERRLAHLSTSRFSSGRRLGGALQHRF